MLHRNRLGYGTGSAAAKYRNRYFTAMEPSIADLRTRLSCLDSTDTAVVSVVLTHYGRKMVTHTNQTTTTNQSN